MEDIYNASHPGRFIRDIVLKSYFLSDEEFAAKIDMPASRIKALLVGEADLTIEIALKLEKALKVPALFWLDMQVQYDLSSARRMGCYDVSKVEVIATHKDEIGEKVKLELKASKKLEEISQTKHMPPKEKKSIKSVYDFLGWDPTEVAAPGSLSQNTGRGRKSKKDETEK